MSWTTSRTPKSSRRKEARSGSRGIIKSPPHQERGRKFRSGWRLANTTRKRTTRLPLDRTVPRITPILQRNWINNDTDHNRITRPPYFRRNNIDSGLCLPPHPPWLIRRKREATATTITSSVRDPLNLLLHQIVIFIIIVIITLPS